MKPGRLSTRAIPITNYDPTGHVLICLMGNYENIEVAPEQMEALIDFCSYMVKTYGLSPDDIQGHKDYSDQTVCPGKNLYRYLEDGSIRSKVAGKLQFKP